MHVLQDSMWQGIWKILQNNLGTKQGLGFDLALRHPSYTLYFKL